MKREGLETKLIERGNRTPLDQSQILPADFTGELIWENDAIPRGYLVDFEMKLLPKTNKNGANRAMDSDKK